MTARQIATAKRQWEILRLLIRLQVELGRPFPLVYS